METAPTVQTEKLPTIESSNQQAAILSVIQSAAENPNVDIDKMERLFVMYERMEDKNKEAAFYSAFAKMQADLPSVAKEGKVVIKEVFRNSYAKFEDINEAILPILKRYGFGLSFRINNQNTITVTGVLSHEMGHKEETSFTLAADQSGNKNFIQAMGSSVSYGKRYVTCALLNIITKDEDDDGQESLPKQQESAPRKEKPNYPDREFKKNLPVWEEKIKSRQSSPDHLIAKINQVYRLSENQKNGICALAFNNNQELNQ